MTDGISIQGISKTFGSFQALKKTDLVINRGEFFSLLGPSGCGKTTLLRIIAGFEDPDEGEIFFNKKNIVDMPINKRPVNTVFQTYALFPHMTVYENIAFPLRIKKYKKPLLDKKVKDYIHLVQLDEHTYKKPNQLSGGQKQRVSIARALINEPEILLLDEPLSALDAKLRANLLVELDTIHDQIGITFIFVTHDQGEALSVSDRIAVMSEGKILQIGEPYEIYEQPATPFIARFIGETNIFIATVTACEPFEDEYMLTLNVPELDASIKVTDYNKAHIGQQVNFTIRPEKIQISLNPPQQKEKHLNIFQGFVEEPIYSGFQTKFFIELKNGTTLKVLKQHKNYLDDGPEIEWKDTVYVSWSAADAYVIENINE